jgi:hypothetical protein
MKTRLHAVFSVVATLSIAGSAAAQDTLGRTQMIHPASECAVKPISGIGATPGSIVYGTFLINNTGAAQEFQCPVAVDSSHWNWELHYAVVDVSAGWVTTQSCQLCVGDGDGWLWCYAPSSIIHASNYRDSVVWDGPGSVGYQMGLGAEMQCGLPNGQSLRDYYADTYLVAW